MDIQQAIKQLAERGYHLDLDEAERVKAEEGYTVPYPFAKERRETDLARSVHIYCYSEAEVYTLLASLKEVG